MLITLAVTFIVVYRDTGSQMRTDEDNDVRSDATQLARAMGQSHIDSPTQLLARARAYAGARTYGSSESVLFAIVPGTGATSDYPELFGGPPDHGETQAEQNRENGVGHELAVPKPGYATQPAPDVGTLRTYEVRLDVDGVRAYAGAGQTLDSVARVQANISRAFLAAGGIVLALAVLIAYLLGARVSAPLRRMAGVAAHIDGGDLGPRMQLPPSTSRELRVLADTFNNMLDRLALAFEGQRQFVADASHELRTPLTIMRGQLDVLATGLDGEDGVTEIRRVQRLLQAELARVTRLVDDLLLLAQSDRADFLRPERIELDELVTEIWDGLSLTATRDFQIAALTPVAVVADPDRLAQALRNLARNAIAHTREPDGIVRIELAVTDELVHLTVSDDGPGIPPQARERVFERFYRTDPARSRAEGGAGLGLAIVRAIVEAHQGTIRVTQSELGGARFEVELPRAVRTTPPAAGGPSVSVTAVPPAASSPEAEAAAPASGLSRPESSPRPQP